MSKLKPRDRKEEITVSVDSSASGGDISALVDLIEQAQQATAVVLDSEGVKRFSEFTEALDADLASIEAVVARHVHLDQAKRKKLRLLILGFFAANEERKQRGRPPKEQTKLIYKKWCDLGKPSVFRNELAKKFFGPKFTAADKNGRRRMRNLCRNAVERIDRSRAPKS